MRLIACLTNRCGFPQPPDAVAPVGQTVVCPKDVPIPSANEFCIRLPGSGIDLPSPLSDLDANWLTSVNFFVERDLSLSALQMTFTSVCPFGFGGYRCNASVNQWALQTARVWDPPCGEPFQREFPLHQLLAVNQEWDIPSPSLTSTQSP